MLKKGFYILVALLLVFTTTGSIWVHLLENEDDPIEISSETGIDGEKSEKETEKELDNWNDHLVPETNIILPELYCGFQKVGSSTFAPTQEKNNKLYLLYRSIKIDC